uniref:Putative secreted protein n=1 Tax=Panstrongylus lignarius TaxID=156445 RepID=A0A224XX07_9HEMI
MFNLAHSFFNLSILNSLLFFIKPTLSNNVDSSSLILVISSSFSVSGSFDKSFCSNGVCGSKPNRHISSDILAFVSD